MITTGQLKHIIFLAYDTKIYILISLYDAIIQWHTASDRICYGKSVIFILYHLKQTFIMR